MNSKSSSLRSFHLKDDDFGKRMIKIEPGEEAPLAIPAKKRVRLSKKESKSFVQTREARLESLQNKYVQGLCQASRLRLC